MLENEVFERMLKKDEIYHEQKESDVQDVYPLSEGEIFAARAYVKSRENDSDVFEVDEAPTFTYTKDFLNALKKADVNQFAYSETSSSLMTKLHEFEKYGWEIAGLCKIRRKTSKNSINGILVRCKEYILDYFVGVGDEVFCNN